MSQSLEQKIVVNKLSRLKCLNLISSDYVNNGKQYIDISTLGDISFKKSSNDRYHRIEDRDINRIDLISYRYYGSVYLWWVIALANDIMDPLLGLSVGSIIRIPDITVVLTELAKRKKD